MEQEQFQHEHQQSSTDLNPASSLFQMNLDAHNSYNLRSASSWAKVLGVCGAITGSILIVLMLILLSKVNEVSRYGGYSYRRSSGFGSLFSGPSEQLKLGAWIMIITGIIFVVGGIFSYHFGNSVCSSRVDNRRSKNHGDFPALLFNCL